MKFKLPPPAQRAFDFLSAPERKRRVVFIGGAILLFLMVTTLISLLRPRVYQGYVEGEYIYVASAVAGRLENLAVHRGDSVQAGQPLFELEPVVANRNKGEAEARVREAEARRDLARSNFARQQNLLKGGVIAQRDFDEANEAVKSAEQGVQASQEQLGRLDWSVDQTRQKSVQAGFVHDTYYVAGEWVPAGRPVVAVLPPENIRARLFVDAKTAGIVHLQQPAAVRAPGVSKEVLGRVTYLSETAEYTPPVIYSRDTRAKLVFLVEISFSPEEAMKLHPGQPVDIILKDGDGDRPTTGR